MISSNSFVNGQSKNPVAIWNWLFHLVPSQLHFWTALNLIELYFLAAENEPKRRRSRSRPYTSILWHFFERRQFFVKIFLRNLFFPSFIFQFRPLYSHGIKSFSLKFFNVKWEKNYNWEKSLSKFKWGTFKAGPNPIIEIWPWKFVWNLSLIP